MERKYLDLITTLIEHHKRFSGLEEILDDIVSDVYQRAESILSTVEDDKLLISYLEKLVSTSIISVPQRLNFKKKRNAKSIDEILNIENNGTNEKNSFTLTVDNVKEENINLNEEVIKLEEEKNEEIQGAESETIEQDILINDASDTAELDIKSDITVNQTLVDRMINGVSINTTLDDNYVEELGDIVYVAKEESDDYESILESNLDEIDILDEVDSNDELISETEFEQNSNIDTEAPFENIINTEELVSEEDVVEETSLLGNDNIDVYGVDDFNIQEGLEESSENVYNEEESEDDSNMIYSVENELDDFIEISGDNNYTAHILPEGFYDRFNSFDFEPVIEDVNSEDICIKLSGLNSDYSELSILKVCELKFYQNKSVSEIAEILGMSLDKVFEALDKITNIIKD